MSIKSLLILLPFNQRKSEQRMKIDADKLMEQWGESAYKVAANMAWREDIGLLSVSDPGHWTRVTLEIGRRLVIQEAPAVDMSLQAA